jgi:hypothetical protein
LKGEKTIEEMAKRSELIFEEYKIALATFGAEPLPLPAQAIREEGVLALLSWLLNEFKGLHDILVTATDNAAAVSCESILALLNREGCEDFSKLGAKDFVYPSYKELGQDLSSVQTVKKSFFRRFWKVSGREAVRAIAAERLKVVGLSGLGGSLSI